MFRKLIKNKKAQNTGEYAILISLVVAGIIAMQTYAQRALQARVRDASVFLKNASKGLGNTLQYEPYYLQTSYNVSRDENLIQRLDADTTRQEEDSTRKRLQGGSQISTYDPATKSGTGALANGL